MLKNIMSEKEMQSYADSKEGYEVQFLFEYAKLLGYSHELLNTETGKEEYIFYKHSTINQ